MSDARDQLAQLHLAVSNARDDARGHWRDIVAVDFERRYWTEIDQTAREFLTEIERFEEVLSRAESAVRNLR